MVNKWLWLDCQVWLLDGYIIIFITIVIRWLSHGYTYIYIYMYMNGCGINLTVNDCLHQP